MSANQILSYKSVTKQSNFKTELSYFNYDKKETQLCMYLFRESVF